MKFRILGKTNLKVSEIGFGCMALGNEAYGSITKSQAIKAIQRALELGCNFFDTADNYGKGQSEKILAEALGKERKNVIIATKCGRDFYCSEKRKRNFTPEYIRFALEKSRERLKLDTIPLFQLHGPEVHVIQDGGVFEGMEEMVEKGLIRYYGISVNNCEEALLAMNSSQENNYNLSTIQVIYNILDKTPVEKVFPLAQANNIGIIVREPLCRGFLTGKYSSNSDFSKNAVQKLLKFCNLGEILKNVEQIKNILETSDSQMLAQLSLKFILANNSVSTVIPGIKNLGQTSTDLVVSDMPNLLEGTIKKLEEIPNLRKRHT